jgi:biopolymer transport protein ExbD
MAIYAPDRRINPTIRRKNTLGRKGVYAGLALTSMVDMFAIMVIFLLQSFSAEGELIVLPKGLELPEATHVGTLQRAAVITVSRDRIEFEGVEVARTEDVAAQTGWAVQALQDALKAHREKLLEEMKAQSIADGTPLPEGQEIKLDQKINISADRRLEFQIVKKIIYNASFAGFPDFRFAVFGKGKQELSE